MTATTTPQAQTNQTNQASERRPLTLAGKKRAPRGPGAESLEGARAEATEYRRLVLLLDELKAEVGLAKQPLIAAVSAHRRALLASGTPVKTVRVPTDGGHTLLVLFTERYGGVGMEDESALRAAFGSQYDLFAEPTETIKGRAGITAAALEDAVGPEAWARLRPMLTIKAEVRPRKGAPEQIAKLYAEGNTDLADDLLTFVDACSQSPSVRAK